MVRIAIGFYVDSKHKWSGSSKELTIKRNVVSEKTGKQNFRPTSGQIPKDWCMCFFTPFFLNLIEQCPWPQPMWIPPFCLCYRVRRSWKNITVHLFMQLCHHSVMYRSKTGFVLPETDAVVFFAAENIKMLNNTNTKSLQWPVDHLSEALCLKMGSEELLSLLSSNLCPLGLLSGRSLPCVHLITQASSSLRLGHFCCF